MTKKLFWLVIPVLLLCVGCSSDSEGEEPQKEVQVALYDREKEAIAYIDYEDEATIYTFEGEPLAYIEEEERVYGFNGKLLGWYSEGVLYDRTSYAVGAIHGIVRGGINTAVTRAEKIKGYKHIKPIKHLRELPSVHPLLKDNWSKTTLTDFLFDGK